MLLSCHPGSSCPFALKPQEKRKNTEQDGEQNKESAQEEERRRESCEAGFWLPAEVESKKKLNLLREIDELMSGSMYCAQG